MPPANADPAIDERLDEVINAYLEAIQTGRAPDRHALIGAHPDLAAGLRRFFAAHDAVERLSRPLRIVAAQEFPDPDAGDGPDRAALVPKDFGDYVLLEVLGVGGMGVVYRALHRGLKRDVALKQIIAGPLASEADIQRFRNEAESAAQLDHPNIVPIHNVGEQNGQRYLTMRLIEGGSLASHLSRFAGNPRAAARLMAAVTRAVHDAHQHGILHRDLKPSNILLDGDGQPHVSDFGLARRIGVESTLTGSGAILGSPPYMAPEQAAGRVSEITTATDVYGLGAILYALLTGRPPFRGETPLETLDQVRSTAPEPPSRANPRVDRDLETICLKCLEKEPKARYGSAQAVAEDLERWLRGEPIEARPVRSVVRAWRWARRNRVVATALGTCGLVFVFAGVWTVRERSESLRQKAVAIKERDRALANERMAGQVIDEFVTEIANEGLDKEPRLEKLLREKLKKAAQYYEALASREDSSAETRQKSGRAHARLGQIHALLGELVLAEQSYRQAVTLFESLQAGYPGVPTYQHDGTEAMIVLAGVLASKMDKEDVVEAEQLYRRAVTICVSAASEFQVDPHAEYLLARAYLGLAGAVQLEGHAGDAAESARRAIELTTELCERFPDESTYREHLARAQKALAAVCYNSGQKDDALRLFQAALATFDALLATHPGDPRYRGDKAATLHNLALTSHDLGDLKGVESSYRAAISLRGELAEEFPAVPEHRVHLAKHHSMLAVFLKTTNQQAAEKSLRQSVTVANTLVRDFPGGAEYWLLRANCQVNLTNLLLEGSSHDEAEAILQESLSQFEGLPTRYTDGAEFQACWAQTCVNLGEAIRLRQDNANATIAFRRAVEHQREALRLSHGLPLEYERLRRFVTAYVTMLFETEQNEAGFHELERMNQPPTPDPTNYLGLATFFATWSERILLGKKPVLGDADRRRIGTRYADLAMANLRKAIDAGFNDVKALNTEPAISGLRGRDDFKAIVRELEAKQVPAQER